jgi:hypothetical protein
MNKLEQAIQTIQEKENQIAELKAQLTDAKKARTSISTSEKVKAMRDKFKINVITEDKTAIGELVGRTVYKDEGKEYYMDTRLNPNPASKVYIGSRKEWREANPNLAEYGSAFQRGTVFTVGDNPQKFYCHVKTNGCRVISKVIE